MTYALELSGLTKTYPGGVQALKGLDLNVEAGDFYALLGLTVPVSPPPLALSARW